MAVTRPYRDTSVTGTGTGIGPGEAFNLQLGLQIIF